MSRAVLVIVVIFLLRVVLALFALFPEFMVLMRGQFLRKAGAADCTAVDAGRLAGHGAAAGSGFGNIQRDRQ